VRRVLTATTVAICGIAAALGVGNPVAAKPGRTHHAQCVRAARSKTKRGKRRAKCKKLKRIEHGRKVVARHSVSTAVSAESAVEPTPSSTPSASSAPPESEEATSGEVATGETELAEEPEPIEENPTQEKPTEEKPRQITAEDVARELLGRLPLPDGAVEIAPVPTLNRAREPRCEPLLDLDRFWHVPGKPRAAVVWIKTHAPAGAKATASGESTGPGGVKTWNGGFSFTAKEPAVIKSEDLVFDSVPAEGGGATLRADAQVVSRPARCVTAVG
jgi:hypothetical protein